MATAITTSPTQDPEMTCQFLGGGCTYPGNLLARKDCFGRVEHLCGIHFVQAARKHAGCMKCRNPTVKPYRQLGLGY